MNTTGAHAFVWVDDWDPAQRARAVAATAEAGFDVLEIPLVDPASIEASDTRALLDAHGLRAACSTGLTHATDISSEDLAVVEAGRRRLHDSLDATRALGAEILTGVLYGRLGRYDHAPTDRGRRNAVAVIRELCAEAGDLAIGLEPVNRYESNSLNTAEQTLRFIDDVGADNLVVHLDTFHMNIEERDLVAPVLACGDRLGYVHVGESHRGALGTGTVDFPSFFDALARVGYAGTVTFESFSTAAGPALLASTLCIWQEPWRDGTGPARDAARFIREQAAAAAQRP